jgi:hypothetical protein
VRGPIPAGTAVAVRPMLMLILLRDAIQVPSCVDSGSQLPHPVPYQLHVLIGLQALIPSACLADCCRPQTLWL